MTNKFDDRFDREFGRQMLRSEFVSAFWAVITERKTKEKFTLTKLAEKLSRNKSVVSRWFSNNPNWELDTISDIAHALEVDVSITLRDKANGEVFDATGKRAVESSSNASYFYMIQTETTSGTSRVVSGAVEKRVAA